MRVEQRAEIAWALGALLPRQDTYHKFTDYYAGAHERMISDVRLRTVFGRLFSDFRLNLCKPVVDSLVDRLQIQAFSNSGLGESTDAEPDDNAIEVWKRNRMARRSGHVHLEAVVSGDAYVIVWPNEAGKATLYPQSATNVAVDYSADEPGKILRAAKLWRQDKDTVRLTLYYPDRLERYASRKNAPALSNTSDLSAGNMPRAEADEMRRELDTDTGTHPDVVTGYGWIKPDSFTYYEDDGPSLTPNPYGVVPVFHFANNADIGEFGISELSDALPVQDMLNYLAFNILVGSEFQAFPQRWATGIEVQRDSTGKAINPFKTGPDQVWIASPSEEGITNPTFGEFGTADLSMLDGVKRSAALDIAQVTQTPPHYFFTASNLVSGESQKTAEQKLDAKVADRHEAFGEVWAAAIALAVVMDRGMVADGLALNCDWKDTKPRNELESWQIWQIKKELGLPTEQILREAGYTQEQIDEFKQEADFGGPQPPVPSQQSGSRLKDLLAATAEVQQIGANPNDGATG